MFEGHLKQAQVPSNMRRKTVSPVHLSDRDMVATSGYLGSFVTKKNITQYYFNIFLEVCSWCHLSS